MPLLLSRQLRDDRGNVLATIPSSCRLFGASVGVARASRVEGTRGEAGECVQISSKLSVPVKQKSSKIYIVALISDIGAYSEGVLVSFKCTPSRAVVYTEEGDRFIARARSSRRARGYNGPLRPARA